MQERARKWISPRLCFMPPRTAFCPCPGNRPGLVAANQDRTRLLNPGYAELWWWTLPADLTDAAERSRWVWARVRTVLARHAGIDPRDLLIRRSANGKPEAPQLAHAFSLAHDDAIAVLAIAAVTALGVDVMSDRGFANPQRLARRLLAPPELAHWQALGREQQLQHLRARFCATEAVVKALDWRLWPALGGIHFVRQGRVARVPLKRAQLYLADGRRGNASFALASDVELVEVVHFDGAA
jgi:phosphopantetheinyl transferase (holo-ACP synthase)